MEETVNQRVTLLKKHFGLGNSEFCQKANISTTTLWNIQNEVEMKPKTIKNICENLNVNRDWLLTGKGEMFEKENVELTSIDPWRDALVSQVKEENTRLQKELERVWQMVQHLTGGAKPNFPKTLSLVGAGQPALLRA